MIEFMRRPGLKGWGQRWVVLLSHLKRPDGSVIARYAVVDRSLTAAADYALRLARKDGLKEPMVETATRVWA